LTAQFSLGVKKRWEIHKGISTQGLRFFGDIRETGEFIFALDEYIYEAEREAIRNMTHDGC
jgi:hypothetical protein